MFQVTHENDIKIKNWLEQEVFPPIVASQESDEKLSSLIVEVNGIKHPYEGAISGSLTYEFTPTSIGIIFKVVHSSGKTLDLTEYDEW